MPEPSAHRLEDLIGNTPLVRLCRIEQDAPGVEIYGKAEFFNPGGSVKDRLIQNVCWQHLVQTVLYPPAQGVHLLTADVEFASQPGGGSPLAMPRSISTRVEGGWRVF
jgi:hypothetical protein